MSDLDPVVQIGDWCYQVVYGELWPITTAKPEHPHRLEPRLHSLLNFFLRHPNTLLAKDTLIDKVWPADEGTDAAVMRAVGALRKVLGDDVRSPVYIATVSKKGYCWLADIKPVELLPLNNMASDTAATERIAFSAEVVSSHRAAVVDERKTSLPWRFISITAGVVLACCASLAYVLAKYTAEPLVRLPDTITPISALSGQEYWPALNKTHSHVVYQHQPVQQDLLNWSVQNLADLKVEQASQQYFTLSDPVWLDEQQLLFRAANATNACAFYTQQLLPDIKPATLLPHWQCSQVLPKTLVRWQDKWLWADNIAGSADIALFAATERSAATEINRIVNKWRRLMGMLLSDNTLYLLVQRSDTSSALYRLTLPDGMPQRVITFPNVVQQFSWWSKDQLLLSAIGRELEILDLNNMTTQRLGALTADLAQASRAPGRVLATQYLDYTTDIYYGADPTPGFVTSFSPWHISNRSESMPAVSEYGIAFISQRTGNAQVWMAQGKDNTQLTRLDEQQHVQQLLWHRGHLLLVLNNRLFQLNRHSGDLTAYPANIETAGRFASCDHRLYWTSLTDEGWQLFTESDSGSHVLYTDVVDVRCGPGDAVVMQFAGQNQLALLQAGQAVALPVQLNWRQMGPEQWFTDASGIYWLNDKLHAITYYDWDSGLVSQHHWPQHTLPLAIYSAGRGVGFVVQQRPHDTDIIWLQNRR